MDFFVGTSGYSYKEWKGSFYPAKFSDKKMLGFYAQQFSTVEMNGTFRRMPTVKNAEAWAAQAPEAFRFILKAPQGITHFKRLKNVDADVAELVRVALTLNERLGPLLFQLPPNFKKDVPRLAAFVELLKGAPRVAVEFRHESWFDNEVYDLLRANACALCVADAEDLPATELVDTAGWGYLRLRREDYTRESLGAWLQRIRAQKWSEAYVLFRHEETPAGPALAKQFLELAAAS